MRERESERAREREREKEKKGSGSGRKGSTDIYNDERGQGAGLRRVHRGYVHRRGRYIDDTFRTCIYIVADAGDHACARAHVRAVRE